MKMLVFCFGYFDFEALTLVVVNRVVENVVSPTEARTKKLQVTSFHFETNNIRLRQTKVFQLESFFGLNFLFFPILFFNFFDFLRNSDFCS